MGQKSYSIWDVFLINLKSSPICTMIIALKEAIGGIIPSIQLLATAEFLDIAIDIANGVSDIQEIFVPITWVVGLIGYTWIANYIRHFADIRLENSLRENFRSNIIEKRAKLKYKHIENQDSWDLIQRVSKTPEIFLRNAYVNILGMLSMLIKVSGIMIVLVTQIWWAALTIGIMSIPLVIIAFKGGKKTYEANRDVSKYIRKYEYLREVLMGRESVDERSLFGYTEDVCHKWAEQYEIARKIQFKADLSTFIKMKSSSIVTAVISILMVIVLISPAVEGIITIGMFISIVNSLFSLIQMMSWELSHYIREISRLKEYLIDISNFSKLEETTGALDIPSNWKIDIECVEFKNVYFKYPGTDKYILNGISFIIEKGKHYAFVGSNGAGKTTITKLITGLYDEYEGEILVNNIDIKDYNQRELKSMFSVVYQDFAKYFVTFKDNVALGDINRIGIEGQREKIENAIKMMDLESAIESLPKGIDTPLGKIKNDGQDLSGGQWQRVGMARSMMSSAPLKILDEPTAALDPISESRVYEDFEDISENGTTIFISHRLGSTKLAKEIFVINEGVIAERGSHEELIKLNGIYADMYESQRSWYL